MAKAFGYDLEILVNVHQLGYRIAEAPIVLDTQRYGRIGMDSIWVTWRDTMAIWYRAYILRYYDRLIIVAVKGITPISESVSKAV